MNKHIVINKKIDDIPFFSDELAFKTYLNNQCEQQSPFSYNIGFLIKTLILGPNAKLPCEIEKISVFVDKTNGLLICFSSLDSSKIVFKTNSNNKVYVVNDFLKLTLVDESHIVHSNMNDPDYYI